MKIIFRIVFVLCTLALMTACGSDSALPATPIPTAAATLTPDLCIEPMLSAEVNKINKLMREFDDYAALASNTPQEQLVQVIPDMQRALRDAEDQVVPACLMTLKDLQVRHMRVVVQTLLAFVGNANADVINNGISQARDLHSQYDIEMARLLGVTLVIPSPMPATEPVQPSATPVPVVTNSGANELNLRNAPDFNAAATSVLGVGVSTPALGRTADNQWILVEAPQQPGEKVWVFAAVVELSVPIETLPIVSP
ncbi:MAG: hypothetical protein HXY38_13965 [Chloroflexi bacterium]|nr:hypothetical protein [Chloroflexota bacterium]